MLGESPRQRAYSGAETCELAHRMIEDFERREFFSKSVELLYREHAELERRNKNQAEMISELRRQLQETEAHRL